jgi:hypothetical protein
MMFQTARLNPDSLRRPGGPDLLEEKRTTKVMFQALPTYV